MLLKKLIKDRAKARKKAPPTVDKKVDSNALSDEQIDAIWRRDEKIMSIIYDENSPMHDPFAIDKFLERYRG